MKVSFRSTYAIKYKHIENPNQVGLQGKSYISKNPKIDKFIREFDKLKGKDDISSYNSQKQIYFLKIADKSDKKLESLAKRLNISVRKVNSKEMNGTQIVSVGNNENGEKELELLDSINFGYHFMEYEKNMQSRTTRHERYGYD